MARVGTYRLKQRQYGHDPGPRLSPHLEDALQFLAALVPAIPPRTISLRPASRPPVVMYTDAEYTPGSGRPPRLGWVIFVSDLQTPLAGTLLVPTEVVDLWCPRRQQIYAAESLAPACALWQHHHYLQDRDIIAFVDNEAACSTLVRGASKQGDVDLIAECTHLLLMRLRCRCWWEWVDTGANASDGLSRHGTKCPVYGRVAVEPPAPAWLSTPSAPARRCSVLTSALQ